MTVIIYGSTTGSTRNAAEMIKQKLGPDTDILEADSLNEETLDKYETLILGCSTWGAGDLQDDWEAGLGVLMHADLTGKRVALFGCGDQNFYPDSFVDAIGILYDAVTARGAEVIGEWPTDGYTFERSDAVRDGRFVGLPLDDENQSSLTESRISGWTAELIH